MCHRMLYHFHAIENEKKSGSVHATYIVAGTKLLRPTHHTNGDADISMRSSPIPSSLPDAPQDEDEGDAKVTSLLLVGQEHLDNTMAQFDEVTSVHVYSLEPSPLRDLQVLSDCSREVNEKYSNEDPLEAWKVYGSIHNPHVRRRTPGIKPQAAAPVAVTAAAKTAPRPSTTAITKQKEVQDAAKNKGGDSQTASRSSTPQVDPAALPNKKTEKKAPTLKKEASSIFASFAKTQPKKKAAGSGTSTPASKPTKPSQAEDETMKDASDEEGEDEDVIITGSNTKSKEETDEAAKKARAERDAKKKRLQDMMEEDDDDTPMQDAPTAAPEEPEESAVDQPAEPEPVPALEKQEDTVTVSNGRRRGRRRITKKRTFQDSEGYFGKFLLLL